MLWVEVVALMARDFLAISGTSVSSSVSSRVSVICALMFDLHYHGCHDDQVLDKAEPAQIYCRQGPATS
ncbi:hypothetical protein E4T56_gene11866 [Termitomyces sp. T112]|nr:hypothetical protein E4T56_gene11866 [Termitomyces sp. T112]